MRLLGMIPVYNESDIIESVINYLVSQGVELVILDNGSTDGSYEICSKHVSKGVLSLETVFTERFEFDLIIRKLYETALSYRPDWILLNAADEFLESPYPDLKLKEAIQLEDQKGYNLIQFNNFEFWPTEQDRESLETDVRKRLKYYTWNDDCQFRCWKVYAGIKVGGSAGHYPVFPKNVNMKIAKNKYVLRHYRIRSYQHGLKKIFTERLPRYPAEERSKGRHVHYDKFGRDEVFFTIHSCNLNKYENDNKWSTKKTFDWTWGLRAKPWANPPAARLSVRFANKFPFLVVLWKAIFLRKKLYNESLTSKRKLGGQSGIAKTVAQLGRVAEEKGD